MANAYATIANGGYRNRPRAIKKIVDATARRSSSRKRWRVHRVKAFEDGVTYEAIEDPRAEHHRRHRRRTPRSAARPAARPARPTRTSTPGSSASRRGCRPRSGSASRATPSRSMNGMYLGGRNIDGGTYPADIWGTYMKQAVGLVLRRLQAPDRAVPEPAVHGPLRAPGRQGRRRETAGDERTIRRSRSPAPRPSPRTTTATTTATPTAAATATTAATTTAATADNGAAFDPNQYETPPQGAPETADPGRRHASAAADDRAG